MKTVSVTLFARLFFALFCGWLSPAGAADTVVTYNSDGPALNKLVLSTGGGVILQTLGTPVQCGSPLPFGYGTASVAPSTVVTSSVAETVSAGDGVRYRCVGWTGTGSIPASGSGRAVTAAITNDSTLTWNWAQQFQLTVSIMGRGSVLPSVYTNIWAAGGTNFFLTAIPATNTAFLGWSGSTNGCVINGRNIRIPMTQARALTALFEGAQTNVSHLVLWNRLGSASELGSSNVGSNALTWSGSFVPGVFGNALQLNAVTNFGVTFPASLVPGSAGCIEFWAKFLNLPASLPAGEQVVPVGVTATNAAHTYAGPLLHLNGNDGAGNGGLCARLGTIGSAGTGLWYEGWTYSSALKGASASDWHHYALVWGVDAVPGFTSPVRRMAVYVDGVLNTGSWLGEVVPPSPLAFPQGARLGLMYVPALADVRPVVDNIKVWDYAKTNFSDRFVEGSDKLWTLKISTAHSQTVPAAGTYSCTNGAVWSVRVASPVFEGANRYVCARAVVTGNAFAQESPTNVVLAVTNNAEVAWVWKTQCQLLTQVEGEGALTPADLWQDVDSTVTLTATPASDWTFSGWKGDTEGCAIDGATITAPMARARALVAVFASVWPKGSGGLVLWNRLGSEVEVGHSEVGPAGALASGSFVSGVFGNACGISSQAQLGASFPLSLLPRYSGCVEFWARAAVTADSLPWGPRLILLGAADTDGSVYPVMHFNGNDGAANGGLCGRLGGIGSIGTGGFGSWTYGGALKGASVAEWHHYALTWGVDGLAGQTNPVRRMALYVDGVLNTGSWIGDVLPPSPVSIFEGGRLGLLFLQGSEVAGAAVDNVKVWNFAKTDFSDRFNENAGVPRFALTVSGVQSTAEPAEGTHSLASGAVVSARVASPVVTGGERSVCTGATVTGNAYETLSETNVLFTVTNTVSLVWNWKIQFRLAVETEGSGRVTAANEWQDEGAEVALEAQPADGWFFGGWEGDTEGCLADGAAIRVPMTAARTLRAVFIERVDIPFETFAAWPENVPLAYRRLSGSWWFSNEYDGLYCASPKNGDSASFQISVGGPGLVFFEWQLFGADGTNALVCSVGGKTRGFLKAASAEQASVAVPAGRSIVQWAVRRGSWSAATFGVLRSIRWEPLTPASAPLPASGALLREEAFSGLAWAGDAAYYRVYAGLTPSRLTAVGSGVYTACAVPAADLADRLAGALGNPVYWRADAVQPDSFGGEAVFAGPVWNFSALPAGAPEFDLAAYADDSLIVGARCALGPFAVSRGAGSQLSGRITSGALPAGLSLAFTDSSLTVAGLPSRAGRSQATVRLSLRTGAGQTVWGGSLLLDLTVAELAGAAGSFEGWADGSAYGSGSAKISVTTKGRISGKLVLSGTNYTVVANSYDGATNGVCFVRTEARQGFKASLPLAFLVSTGGVAQASFVDEPDAVLALLRNSWSPAELAAYAGPLADSYAVALPDMGQQSGSGAATLTVMANGKTQFSGRVGNRGRFTYVGSILVVPAEGEWPDRFFVVVYGALPNANSAQTAGGLFGVLEIVPGTGGANTVEEVVPLRTW